MLYSDNQIDTGLLTGLQFVRTTLAGHVMTLTLNRPEKKNALHRPMLNELAYAVAYAHYTPEVWLVVLAAEGDTFCAGMDLKSLVSAGREAGSVPEPAGPVRLGELMAGLHKPCIARVQGPVYAGGFLLVAGSTYVVASETATFSLPEVKRGLFPFQVMASLMEIMPARAVLDLCLRARTLTAQDAAGSGLVTHVVRPEALDTAIDGLVSELVQYAPSAMQFGLRAYQQLKSLPPDQQQAFLYEQFQLIQQTADAKEGMNAFLEKRPPQWTGR